MNAQAKILGPVHEKFHKCEQRMIWRGCTFGSQIVYTSYVIKVFFAYSSSEWSGEPAHSHSLTRAFGITLKIRVVDEGLGQIV